MILPHGIFSRNLIRALLLASFAFLSLSAKAAGELSLAAFLDQVRGNHKGIQASATQVQAAEEKIADSDLMLAPNLFASVQQGTDKKTLPNPQIGEKSTATGATVGVSRLTDFGLTGKLSYSINKIEIDGASPAYVPDSKYFEAKPTLELNQALWKNSKGRETRTVRELASAQAEVIKLTETYKQRLTTIEAENSYWRLALAREAVTAQRESLGRSSKLRDWSAGRSSLQLADRADLLQAEAAVKGRKLELQIALDEERSASRAFNAVRGKDDDVVSEPLEKLSNDTLEHLAPPKRTGSRLDLDAMKAAQKITSAAIVLVEEKYTPQLDLFASLSLNGRDTSAGDAMSNSLKTTYPTSLFGVKISAALGGESISRLRSGAMHEAQAGTLGIDRKEFEDNSDWKNLEKSHSESKARLELARDIEAAQKERLTYERERHRTGRSTTFQVITAEQDYANAQLSLIRAQADLLRIVTQMKSFGGQI